MVKYNPSKLYKWEEDVEFILGGNEFGLILNSFRAILSTPEAQQILLINEASNTVEGILKRYVETGLVEEIKLENSEPQGDHQKGTSPVKNIIKQNTVLHKVEDSEDKS